MNEQIIKATLTTDILAAAPFFVFSILFAIATYVAYRKKLRGIFFSCVCWAFSLALFITAILQVDLPLYDYVTKSYFSGAGYVSGYSMSSKQPHIVIDGYECRITDEYCDQEKFVGEYVYYTVGANSNYVVSISNK